MTANTKKTVPIYDLYGESIVNSEPGFVHIESIAERSSALGWVIKAHRHRRLFQILCILNGEFEVDLNTDTHSLNGNWIVTIPPGVIHGFRFRPNSEGFVLSVDTSLLNESSGSNIQTEFDSLQPAPELIHGTEDSEQHQSFLQYMALIEEEFRQLRSCRNDALAWLAKLAVLSLSRQVQQRQINSMAGTVDSQILSKFRSLLETNYRKQWSVSMYAEKLHISTSTLSRLCHQYVGESPKEIIQKRVIGEAKRKLLYTRQTQEEIAYALGFKDQAYFSRFFKKREKLTPGNYRKHGA